MNQYLNATNELLRIQQLWQQSARKFLKAYDITYPQFRVLSGLVESQNDNKRITQAGLSELIGIDVMTLSTIIRNLESRRLVRRVESRSDTRAKNVYMTSIGLSLMEEMMPSMEMAAEIFFEDLAETGESLLDVLTKEMKC
ncbi:MarR family winged helix-turn-helix transcriptional regulator [Macrococcus equipercicus]|uniref:MarR family transcriptional regulator n=1 Tax=Macrococcus equipercicus TaxID=69967 RepID=A0A9Q9F3W3_9STAP|nr:MarR family transcriptional regulator [Macrococcus equipercicus]KAA1040329.1 MarR family transcriptional regulator [Macrococcus equipercicus]UTH14789.1 MarR family transcriptional regulator [Macrococcus equipercicus]